METVFHFGENSDKFLREFEDKRADYSLHDIAEMPVPELKHLLCILQKENRTFAEAAKAAV